MKRDVYGPYGQDKSEYFGKDAVEAAEPVVPLPGGLEEVTKTRPKLAVDLSGKNTSVRFPMLVLLLLISAVGTVAAFWAASYSAWNPLASDPESAQATAHVEGTAVIPPDQPPPQRSFTYRPRERFESIHWDKDRRKRMKELRKDRLEARKEERKRWEEDLKEFYKRGERKN